MSNEEKRWRELLQFPAQMRFEEVRAILEVNGFVLTRSKGSHNRFRKMGEQPIDVPTTKGRFVKRTYLKLIAKRLSRENQ